MAWLEEFAWALGQELQEAKAEGTTQGVVQSQDAAPIREALPRQCRSGWSAVAAELEEVAAPLLPSPAGARVKLPGDGLEVPRPRHSGKARVGGRRGSRLKHALSR